MTTVPVCVVAAPVRHCLAPRTRSPWSKDRGWYSPRKRDLVHTANDAISTDGPCHLGGKGLSDELVDDVEELWLLGVARLIELKVTGQTRREA